MLSLEVLEYCSRLSKNVEEKASCWLDGVQGDKCAIKSQYFSLLSLFALWCIVYPTYTYVLQNKHKNGRRGAFTISLYRFPCRTDKICISSLFIKNDTSKPSRLLSRALSLCLQVVHESGVHPHPSTCLRLRTCENLSSFCEDEEMLQPDIVENTILCLNIYSVDKWITGQAVALV